MSRPPARTRPSLHATVLLAALVLLLGAPAASMADDADTGPGVVQGIVRDVAGRPVEGATVELATTTTGPDYSWHQHRRTATTSADGRYRLDGIVTPDVNWDEGIRARADGYVDTAVAGIQDRLRAAPTTPITADLLLRRPDVTISGRLSVRDGGAPSGGRVTATLAELSDADQRLNSSTAWAGDDGRWEMHVPAGSYRLTAESDYGLPTKWPDLAVARPAPATAAVPAGGSLGGLDFSMRLRLPGAAKDEYGTWQYGWDANAPAPAEDARYPRDPYRSVTVVRGAAVSVGTPQTSAFGFPLAGLPGGDLVTVTGSVVRLTVPITNTGDDVLWVDSIGLEGTSSPDTWCSFADGGCTTAHAVMPGETKTVTVTPVTDAYAPDYAMTLVVTSSAGADTRVPLRLRNVGTQYWGPNDPHNVQGVLPYLSDADRAQVEPYFGITPESKAWAAVLASAKTATPAAPAGAPAPAVRKPPALGVVTVARTSVRFTFPAAGRIDVVIDRLVRSKNPRKPDRWAKARTVRLTATRPGARSARIKRLAVGPYRVRIVARIAGRVHRVTDYRDVKGR